MNVRVVRANIQDYEADALVVNLFEGVTTPGGATGAVDHALGGQIGDLIAGGDFQGKLAETAVLYSRGVIPAKRVILVGLGKQEKFDLEAARRAAGAAAQQAQKLRLNHLATIAHGGGLGGLDAGDAAQATVEGTLSALYQFEQLQSPAEPGHRLGTLTVVERNAAAIEAVTTAATAAEAIMAGVYLARELVNLPPNIATPTYMADAARQIAEAHNMAITVGDREWAAEHKMGAFLGVAQGAGEPPYFIVMEHNGDQTDLPAIVLVVVLVATLQAPLKTTIANRWGADLSPTANLLLLFAGLGAVSWLTMARIVRGQVLSLRERNYIAASRVLGASHIRILLRHVLPNVWGVVMVYLTLTIPSVILYESFLSYLGLGVEPPFASLGYLIADGAAHINAIRSHWWLIVFPGGALTGTLLALNLAGDGLRDAWDPRDWKE